MGSKYACADCGAFADSMDPCRKCGSVRVVLVSVLESALGPHWHKAFEDPEPAELAGECGYPDEDCGPD